MYNIEQFVDWQSGVAIFDTGEFAKILEFAETFPLHPFRERSEYTEIWDAQEMLTDNRQILYAMELSDYHDFLITRTILGGELVFKGFPTEDRNGNSFLGHGALAITSASTDKRGAWSFVRQMLKEDWHQRFMFPDSFPILSAIFVKRLTEQLNLHSTHHMGGPSGGVIHIPNLTAREAELITNLVNTTTHIINHDPVLWNIIIESASDYFNGRNTLENTIRIIQNRASTYMSEQTG